MFSTQLIKKVHVGLQWLDDHILLLLGAFLLAFIPLWPKIPLWSPIEQYIVRVRAEDFVLLATGIIWFIQVVRKKVAWRSPIFWLVAAYGVVGLLSVLSALFVIKSVPLAPLHVGKTVLHYFRYLEYFSIFFILFAAIKKRSDVSLAVAVFALTVTAISIYGYGQKYYYWPVYSTMNREFSKGVRLYLTPHARVQSTFAGHYDMAAFLVVALPLLLAMAYSHTHRPTKYALHTAFWVGTWLIIVSASRTSFVAYLATMGLVVLLLAAMKPTWWQKIRFFFSRSISLFLIILLFFFVFGGDLSERLAQVIDSNPTISNAFHRTNARRKDLLAAIRGDYKPPEPPKNAVSTDDAIAQGILTPTDERPITTKPSDVYVDVPDIVQVASKSASGAAILVEIDKGPRVYSDNALKHGLSLAIRLDTLWPRAIAGFMRNPLLGKGYATLNKETDGQFTEAESTDNNFLRTLGETGLLGFMTFYGVVGAAMWFAWQNTKSHDVLKVGLGVGFIAASVGLLLNALYIDVFAASKVALSYWSLAGVVVASYYLKETTVTTGAPVTSVASKSPVVVKSTPTKSKSKKRS